MQNKYCYSIFFSLLFILTSYSQKLNPDVELISEIISQKQEEIKQRVLKNLVVKNIKTTNYTTYNSMYNLLSVLTTEKNKTVMTKSIITEMSNYAVSYGLANFFIKKGYHELDILNVVNIDGISLNIDKQENSLASLMGVTFKTGDKNGELKDTQTDRNRIESLIANYILDELYEKLSKRKINVFESIGLFKESDIERRFTFGLDIDYTKIDKNIKDNIDSKLDWYLDELTNLSDSSETLFKLINDNSFRLDNLSNLSEASIKNLVSLFSFSLSEFKEQIGKNSFLSTIGEIINKYIIYDLKEEGDKLVFKNFKIDVEAIILGLEDQFFNKKITSLRKHKIGIEPFFIIGMNYGSFSNSNSTIPSNDGNSNITDLAFVSEKFGLKFMLFDFEYSRSHKPLEWFEYRGLYRRWRGPVSEPLINNIYISLYGSGILYNVVDLKSQENFDFGMVGIGIGVSFFNDLELNISYATPYIDKSLSYDNSMIVLGFDIPIFEYIKALKNKNR